MKKNKPTLAKAAKKAVLRGASKVKDEVASRTEATRERARKQTIRTAQSTVKLQKKAFDGAFKLIAQLQTQSEKAIKQTVDQAEWLPKEGKAIVDEWVKTLHGGRSKFQETVDKSFGLVNQFLTRVEAEPAPKAPAKKAPAKKAPAKKTAAKKKPAKKA